MSSASGGGGGGGGGQNQYLVPQASQGLEALKQETAAELGLANYQGYRGNIPSRENGAVGGNMVRKMIRFAEAQLQGAGGNTTGQ